MNGGFLVFTLIVAGFYVGQAFAGESQREVSETNSVQTEQQSCVELTGYPTDYYGHCSEPDDTEGKTERTEEN